MDSLNYKCVLISDFNLDVFSGYLKNDETFPSINTTNTPFGQVAQLLMQSSPDCLKDNPDIAVIWTRPEGVINSFNDVLAYNNPAIDDILTEVDQFAAMLLNFSNRFQAVFFPTWVLPAFNRGIGMLDMKKDTGITNILMQMNLRLSENFRSSSNIYILDTQHWVHAAGKHAFNPKLWYRGKIAFGNEVYKEAVKDIKSAIRGIKGLAKKIIILDLDDTLWGGIVGDAGWENLSLGGHDPIGESYADFQHALKALTNRGVLLAIVSKNEESVALEAIKKHPEMVLGVNDFAGWKINWRDKAQNIVDLISDLNLGLQSAVFIDDNPVERARVAEALPEVYVPEWPKDCMLYKSTLLGLRCFDTPSISKEDMERKKMYVSERQRTDLIKSFSSLDEWLKSLEIKVEIDELNDINLQRTAQLFNKTNQMNLSTRRMSEAELVEWTNRIGNKLWVFRVSDKLGDSGLTGIASLSSNEKTGRITDFILSCRVMGRNVEETMLYTIIQYARKRGLESLVAQYIPTSKNKPCLDFWKRSDFQFDENKLSFIWNLKEHFHLPGHIEIIPLTSSDNKKYTA